MATATMEPRSTRKERWAWYLYDFGNSAYAAVVLLAVFSAYFKEEVVGGAEGTRLWGIAVFIAMFVVAVTSPFLGAIADFSGSKKRFLLFYTVMACLFTAALFFAQPGQVAISMAFFILAEIGYRSAQVFYNGLLTEIAEPEEMGRISGNGWAIGTAGGIICLLIILPLVVMIKGLLIIRVSLVITAVFFALSAVPIFIWLPERAQSRSLPPGRSYWSVAIERLRATIQAASRFKEFLKFMLAFLIYNDAVIMALDFAAIIGAVLFGMDQEQLIIFVIVVQATNVAGAYVFGWLVDRIGGKRSLVWAIVLMILVVIWLYFTKTVTGYFLVGAVAGVAMAGMQSVSRTMVALFSPSGQGAEFYGFFAVIGRTSSFIGPAVYGLVASAVALRLEAEGELSTAAEQAGQRSAILVIVAFLVVGLILLALVKNPRPGEADSQRDSQLATESEA
jgi:UMF1 family MFS transporter